MATATPQQCCLPAPARPRPISAPLRLRYLTRGASSIHFPWRRTPRARRGRTFVAFSPRCTLETAGPAFDPLGLCTEDSSGSHYQSPLSTFFGILSPVFGSSSGSRKENSSYGRGAAAAMEDSTIDIGDFFKGPLPGKFLKLLGFLALSRLGVYIPLGGVNREAFAGNLDQNSLLGTLDSFSGGGIGRLGICSLGIVPFINAQIVFQLLAQLYPKLQDLQKKEGEAGRKKILQYTRYASVGFAIVQAIGQVLFLRPYVNDFSTEWVLTSVSLLTLGSVFTTFLGETISELKLGNGTSLLIFTSIISYLPASFGRTVAEGFQAGNYVGLLTIILSFIFLVLGIVYVQEAERKIPLNYASRYSSRTGGPQRSAYLPFKVNSSGVMPIIFSTSSLALPATLARFTGLDILKKAAIALTPGGSFYLPTNVMLIAFFNYYYTFLQLDPDDLSEQLKRQGASIPLVRPGKNTAAFIRTMDYRCAKCGDTRITGCTHVVRHPGFTGLRGRSRQFYIELHVDFLAMTFIPCLARHEVLDHLNVGIDEETTSVAELTMANGRVNRIAMRNDATRSWFDGPSWRAMTVAEGFHAGNGEKLWVAFDESPNKFKGVRYTGA